MDVLKGDMIPIPDDALDAVAGGNCYSDCDSYIPCSNHGQLNRRL